MKMYQGIYRSKQMYLNVSRTSPGSSLVQQAALVYCTFRRLLEKVLERCRTRGCYLQ